MPYFHQLKSRITTAAWDQDILDYAAVNHDQFYQIPYGLGWDGNQLLRIDRESDLPWLEILRNQMPLSVTKFVLVRHDPGCRVMPHRDRNPMRSTVIATAITPRQHYADTVFWQGDQEVARCCWSDQSVILDTQQTHSLENGLETRISFQLCFREPFDTVVNLMEN